MWKETMLAMLSGKNERKMVMQNSPFCFKRRKENGILKYKRWQIIFFNVLLVKNKIPCCTVRALWNFYFKKHFWSCITWHRWRPAAPSQMWNQIDMGYRKAAKLNLKNSYFLFIYEVTSCVLLLSERHCPKNGVCGILPDWEQENGIKSSWNVFEVSTRKLVGMILKSQDVLKLSSWFSNMSPNYISKPPEMFLSLKLDRLCMLYIWEIV